MRGTRPISLPRQPKLLQGRSRAVRVQVSAAPSRGEDLHGHRIRLEHGIRCFVPSHAEDPVGLARLRAEIEQEPTAQRPIKRDFTSTGQPRPSPTLKPAGFSKRRYPSVNRAIKCSETSPNNADLVARVKRAQRAISASAFRMSTCLESSPFSRSVTFSIIMGASRNARLLASSPCWASGNDEPSGVPLEPSIARPCVEGGELPGRWGDLARPVGAATSSRRSRVPRRSYSRL